MKLQVMIFLAFIAIAIDLNGQSLNKQSLKGAIIEENKLSTNEFYQFKIISSKNNTWGYDILKKNILFIHQTSIPGLPGNEGFKIKSDAEKVAKLVIEKLEKGEMPPSVTQEELKKMKVL